LRPVLRATITGFFWAILWGAYTVRYTRWLFYSQSDFWEAKLTVMYRAPEGNPC